MAQMTVLRRRMIDDMTLRNLSPATQQSYVYAVAKFSRFFGRSPDQLGVEEVRAYQIHLAGRGLSWPHLNQVSCALRFFFELLAEFRAFLRGVVDDVSAGHDRMCEHCCGGFRTFFQQFSQETHRLSPNGMNVD